MFVRVGGCSGKKFCQLLTRKKWRKKVEMCAKNNQRRVLSALCLGPLGLLGSLDHFVCGPMRSFSLYLSFYFHKYFC